LAYLRANGFKIYIVSAGGIEFLRTFSERVYGVPPEQIIGSSIKTRYEVQQGKPVILRLAEMDFIDEGPGKPVAIQKVIGRHPIAAFGNSDGDLQMLEWTTSQPGPTLAMIVHHTDGTREWAYDRSSPMGRLDKALEAAATRGWAVVDMKADWRSIYP
jgi:haloacid dehalogenase-like hydrolase